MQSKVVVSTKLVVRFSARQSYIGSSIITIIGLIIGQLAPRDGYIWVYYIATAVGSFGSGGCIVATLGLPPRVLAHDRVHTGNKRGGFISMCKVEVSFF